MYIQGAAYVHGAQPINAPHRSYNSQPAASPSRLSSGDELSISSEADMVSRALELPDIRADKVASIKAQIANGSYDTDEKLDIALSRLLDEIG
jgi:negative regulator of flagellin synthesis FlgM